MEYLLIGKYVSTHGIKGEIKLISDFRYKEDVFKPDFNIYLGKDKLHYVITGYRKHKQYDMLTLDKINNINDIINLKGSLVYINKEDLTLKDKLLLIEDLIGYNVYIGDKLIGSVIEVLKGKANDVLVVSNKRILIPYVKDFILKVDESDKLIEVNDVKGLIV